MEFEICCLTLTLASLMIADLNQTADFTSVGIITEQNFLARPFVKYKDNKGEVLLGAMGASLIFSTYDRAGPIEYAKVFWLIGHGVAVYHNYKDNKIGIFSPIILPIVKVTW